MEEEQQGTSPLEMFRLVASEFRNKQAGFNKPYNVKLGWNIFEFNAYTLEKVIDPYYKRENIEFSCPHILFQRYFGLEEPKNVFLNVSLNLGGKICYFVREAYGDDKIPQYPLVVVFRFDKYDSKLDKLMKERGFKTQAGRVRYFVGVIKNSSFEQIYNVLQSKRKNLELWDKILNPYILNSNI